jgi:hypothetical protein
MMAAIMSIAAGFFASSSAARPLVPAERRYIPYSPELPACDDANVLERIRGHFHDREAEFWQTGLEIMNFDRISERGYRTLGEDYIPRRYCQAQVYMNDQALRQVSYSIGQDLGIIGMTYGVEWCVIGLDRHDAYSIACRMLQP